jgi:hypothetical protein
MRVWHPEVHRLFGERLHYYLLTVRPFNAEEFRKKIEQFKVEKAIGGFCYYEVFGAFDIVLRVWVPAKTDEDKFIDELRVYVPEIDRAIPFRITDIASYWCRDIDLKSYNVAALNRVTVDRVRGIQNGNKSRDGDEFKKNGLLTEIEPSANVKFFITLSNPQPVARNVEERFQRELTTIINSYRPPANQLLRVSMYFGYGFAWALIKAETPAENYFLVGNIIEELNRKLFGISFFTTTYLATGTSNSEVDDISHSSLTAAHGFDLKVARLLPEFYNTEMPSPLQTAIVHWVQNHVKIDSLKENQRALIGRALSGIVAQDEKVVFAALQDFFVGQERFLRANWQKFVEARLGNKAQEVLRAVHVPQGESSKMFALGVLCNICAEVIKQSSAETEKRELASGWHAVANLRNQVAHGACEPLKDWPEMLSILLESFSKLDDLETVIRNAAEGKTPP